MATEAEIHGFRLVACRELLESHPESVRIREQVDALEEAMPGRPGVVVSFCRTIIETTCKTILTDRGQTVDARWEAPKLLSEALKFLSLGRTPGATTDPILVKGLENLVRGMNQIVSGVVDIRNAHGSAAHGADAYAPLLDASYAEIVARATDTVVGAMFKTHLRSIQDEPPIRFRYRDHSDFDDFIDETYGPFQVYSVPLVASEALFYTDFEAYRALLDQFLEDQSALVQEDAATGSSAARELGGSTE